MAAPPATPDARSSSFLPWATGVPALAWGFVPLLIAAHAVLGVMSTARMSATFDEPTHVVSGEVYWRFNDYRFQPENGNLPQRWCALGNYLFRSATPTQPTDAEWERSDVWTLVRRLLAGDAEDIGARLARARMFAVFWGACICGLVYWTSRKIFGPDSGFLSLALCAFCPTLLASSPLATSDACAAFFFLAATICIWELLHRVDVVRWVLTALAVSGLFLAKFSAPVILPIAAILTAIRLIAGYPTSVGWFGITRGFSSRRVSALIAVGNVFAIGIASWGMVWTAYGWRYATMNPELSRPGEMYFGRSLDGLLPQLPSRDQAAAISSVAKQRLLPEAYCYGAAYVIAKQERDCFFNGEYSTTGWLAFFPYCFAVKTSPLLFAALLASAVAWAARRRLGDGAIEAQDQRGGFDRGVGYACIPLVTLFVVYWMSALSTTLNIGHRHILPTYPPLYVVAGAGVAWIANKTLTRWMLVGGTIAAAAIALSTFPHYVAYFNGVVTRDGAYRHLVDSSLDWGQDLPALRDWLEANAPEKGDRTRRVFLDYFGVDSPRRFGIEAEPVIGGCRDGAIAPGLYCFSATELQAVYLPEERQWTPETQQEFDRLRALAKTGFAVAPRDVRVHGQIVDSKVLPQAYSAMLRFRLRTILRSQQPLANIGGSILVFDVTPERASSIMDD